MKSAYRTPFTYFDLVETFPKPGCAVCNLLQRDVQQYIDNMLFEFANDPGLRATFADARGMCIEHGQMMRYNKIGNVIGIARLYRDTLDEVLRLIDQTPLETTEPPRVQRLMGTPAKANSAALADALEPREGCVACEKMNEYEAEYVRIFGKYIHDTRFQEAYRESQGICLPHFRHVLRATTDPASVKQIIAIQRDIWRGLRDEVIVFMDAQNYEHMDDPIGTAGDSWIRAILRMAGERGVFGTRRKS